MEDPESRKFKFWTKIYRLLGHPPTQAEWKARARCEGKKAEKPQMRTLCACGFHLKPGQRECPRCGRKQWIPESVNRFLQVIGLRQPSATLGTVIALSSMMLGYLVQLFVGEGNLISPTKDWTEFYDLGASIGALNLVQPWRMVTYGLLHGGIMHLLFNAFALIQVGPLVEMRFGTGRFALCWVLCGALGILAPSLIFASHPLTPTVGSSGAIFGLIGMALLRGHLDGDARGILIRNVMLRWTIYTTVFGLLMGGVAHGAHFGGLLAGMLFCVVFPPEDGHPSRHRLSPVLGGAGLLIYLAAIGSLIAWNLEGHPLPESVGNTEALAIYEVRVQNRGVEQIFDQKEQDLFHRAWVLNRSAEQNNGVPEAEGKEGESGDSADRLQIEVISHLKHLPMNQRIPFLRELFKRMNERQMAAWDAQLGELIASGMIPSPRSLQLEEDAE